MLVLVSGALAAGLAVGGAVGDGLSADLRADLGRTRLELAVGPTFALTRGRGGPAAVDVPALGLAAGLWFGQRVADLDPVALHLVGGLRWRRDPDPPTQSGAVAEGVPAGRVETVDLALGLGASVRRGRLLLGLDAFAVPVAWTQALSWEGGDLRQAVWDSALAFGAPGAGARVTVAVRLGREEGR